MKTAFRIIVIVLLVIFYSCKKDDVTIVDSSISSEGVISGIIVNASNRIDSIEVHADSIGLQLGYNVVFAGKKIGKSTVSSDGNFSVALTTPILSKIGAIPNGVIVSDTAAMTGYVHYFNIYAHKGGIYTGKIYKSNEPSYTNFKAGWSVSSFKYSDRPFTVKGTEVQYNTQRDGYIEIIKINYNLTFKKGWNELVLKTDSYSETATTSTTVETYSNIVISDLQWRYYPNNNALTVRAKTQGVRCLARKGFLFK